MGEKSNRKQFVAIAKKEKINHPSHYIDSDGRECIDVMIEKFGIEAVKIWCRLTAFKYQFRAGKKEGEPLDDDIAKERWYLDKVIELTSEQ